MRGQLTPWKSFAPTPKISPLTLRARPTTDTLARLHRIAGRVPISRVADLTPLDRLRLPIFSATTPLAVDLTTHLGKGLDHESAQVSAMMEAVERVSAERVERPVVRRSFRRMVAAGAHAVDPHDFDLPDDTSYTPDRPITWIEGFELVGRRPVWVPHDLATSPPREGVLRHVDTNGLAAGNSRLEAIVHGLCEVIERDSVSLSVFAATYGLSSDAGPRRQRIDLASVPAPGQAWIERLRQRRLDLIVEHIVTDIDVPVFRSVVFDHAIGSSDGESARATVGFGAGPSASAALLRSVTEAVQSRVALIHGARDSFNTVSPPRRPSTGRSGTQDLEPRDQVDLASIRSFESDDLRDDYRFLAARLGAAGFTSIVCVDLSRRDLGFPVVRVRVPGLSSFVVDRSRMGWRCLRYLL